MTNKKYDFLCRVISVADSVGRFDIAEVSQTDEDVQLLMELRDCGWLHIEAGNHYVTLAGKNAYLSEKETRDEQSDDVANKRATESCKKPPVILCKLALWLAATIGAALITHVVTVIFQ